MVIDFRTYLSDARLKEDVVADLFLRLDKNRGARVSRARQNDRKLRERLDEPELDPARCGFSTGPGESASKAEGRRIYLVGPELAGMLEQGCEIARDLLEAGYHVTLLTRAHAGEDLVLKDAPEIPQELSESFPERFAVRPVKPLESFAGILAGKPGTVVSFYPPLSAALGLRAIPHILILDGRNPDLFSFTTSGLLRSEDLESLLCLPEYVLSLSPVDFETGRTVFSYSPAILGFLSRAKPLPFPAPPAVPDVSACIIARDEEGMIEDCLLSLVPVADETIVNDTGSADGTARVAAALGAKVFATRWEEDFSKARNACLERASCMYVLTIDADERVSQESKALFKRSLLPRQDGYVHAFLLSVKNLLGEGQSRDCQLMRIHLNRPSYRFRGKIHEQIHQSIKGPISFSPIVLDHLGYRPLVSRAKDKRKRNILLLAEALETGENRAYYEFQLGVEMRNTGNFAEAIPLLRRAFAGLDPRSPSRPVAALALVESYVALGRFDDLLAFWEEAKRDLPGLLEVAEIAAEGLVNAGRVEEALAILEETSSIPAPAWVSETDGVRTFILEFLLCKVRLAQNDVEKARTHLERALSSNPDYGPAQRLLVNLCPDGAVQSLKAHAPSTVRPAVLESLRLGRVDLALDIAKEFSAVDPGSLGEIHLARGEFPEASSWFLKSGDAWDRMRGQVIRYWKEPSVSRQGFDEVVEDVLAGRPSPRGRIPEVVKVLGFLVDIGAFDLFERGLKALSSCEDPEFFAGSVLFERGFKDLAADFLVTSLKRARRPETLAMLAEVAWDRKLWDECVTLYGELQSFRPLRREETVRCISALTNLGDLDRARELLDKTVALYGNDPTFDRVGQILRRMKEIAALTSGGGGTPR